MIGRYTFFVAADLPTKSVNVCSMGVMGTRVVRDETLVESIEVRADTQFSLSVPHVYPEDVIGTQFVVDLRQQAGVELSFVTLSNGPTSTEVVINTVGVDPGDYILVIESFDSSSSEGFTLKIDKITIVVIEAVEGQSDTLAYFATELELKSIISG